MLRFLRIRNLAVVEAVEVEFTPGFTVLTGETGAGKSIVVEAVGLLLGGRAAADLVRTGESLAVVEAIFEDAGEEFLVRREITAQGRSRAFVNGELLTSAALRTLAARLVELHGQHEHQALLDPSTHLPMLDSYAGLDAPVAEVAAAWNALQEARERCARASMNERERAVRLDLLAFQLGELDKVAPKAGEDVELQATRQVLANAERVERLCEESVTALYDSDTSALSQLALVWKRVGELAHLDPQFSEYLALRETIKPQLEDLAVALRRYGSGIDASPQRLQQIEERLAAIERLKKRFGPTLDDVLAAGEALRRERDALVDPDQEIGALDAARVQAQERYLSLATALSRARRHAAPPLTSRINDMLGQLAMPRASVDMRFSSDEDDERAWGPHGIDRAEFFIAPNPGEAAKPLARIVSGGELSRVMLAFKTIAAEQQAASPSPRTLVFDEVDTGIGGHVATVVAQHLERLGTRFQVLCVTHLPQIAARGTSHYAVSKEAERGRTRVFVQALQTTDARVEELARMIGGRQVTEPLRASARELLNRPRATAKGKENTKGESERSRVAR